MGYQLFESAKLGPLELRNRTIRSATNEHLSEPDGQLTADWANAQIELAKGGVGLVITGHMTVDRTQRADEGQPVIDRGIDMALFKKAADEVHAAGGKILVQISHSGIKGMASVNGRPAMKPEDFTVEELDKLVELFADAALICKEAGFDGIQVHNAHGYLLSNFLNPNENHRTDEYGGSLENRFRLTGRIFKAIREACGSDFAMLVKADSNGSGDLHRQLELYQQAGVDAVEISGVDFNTKAKVRTPFYFDELMAAKDGIDLPFILVGGMFSRQTAQAVLDAGIPFVAFCRSLIHDPGFIGKLERGEVEESKCLSCNACYKIYRSKPVRCVTHTESIAQLEKLYGPYGKN